jgi:cytochrome c oxidase subunit 3
VAIAVAAAARQLPDAAGVDARRVRLPGGVVIEEDAGGAGIVVIEQPATLEAIERAATASRAHAWRLAVWLLIVSEALLFAALFALYTGYRAEYPQAFARGVAHDVQWIGGINTLILIASSFAMAFAVMLARAGRDAAASRWLVAVIAIGVVFVALKLAEWIVHAREGLVLGPSYAGPQELGRGAKLFFTLYFLMTGLHLLHLVAGIALVAWALARVRRGPPSRHVLALELVGVYWNFVDAIWMFLWPLFYLMKGTS